MRFLRGKNEINQAHYFDTSVIMHVLHSITNAFIIIVTFTLKPSTFSDEWIWNTLRFYNH